jgi:hypothetical protein
VQRINNPFESTLTVTGVLERVLESLRKCADACVIGKGNILKTACELLQSYLFIYLLVKEINYVFFMSIVCVITCLWF